MVIAMQQTDGRGRPTREGRIAAAERFAAKHFLGLVFAVAVACALISVRASRGGSFRDDDLVNIGYSQDTGFSIDSWLGPARFREHLVPGASLVHKLIAAVGPEWWMAQLAAAVLVAILVLGIALTVRAITESPWFAIGTSTLVGTSVVVVSTANWWTAAAVHLPMLCAAAFTTFAALRWLQTRSKAWFAVAIAGQLLACSFSDRAVPVPLMIAVVLVAAGSRTIRPTTKQVWADLKAALPLIVGLFAVVLLQIALTLMLSSAETANPALTGALHTGHAVWTEVVRYWWEIGVAATVLNSWAAVVPDAMDAALTTGGAAGLALIAIVAGLTIRSTKAALIWAALAILVTVSGIQIAFGRLIYVGPQVLALVPRYQELTVLFIAFLVPAAWVASGKPLPRSRPAAIMLAGVAAAFAVSWLAHLRTDIRGGQPHVIAAATYARTMKASLQWWEKQPGPKTLLEERVPGEVVFAVPATQGYNFASRVARVFAPDAVVPPLNAINGRLLRLDQGGSLREVRSGPSSRLHLKKLGGGRASPAAVWGTAGGYWIPARVPTSVASSGHAILLRVELAKSGGVGSVGVLAVGAWPSYELAQDKYPHGFRVVMPAGTSNIELQLWHGASTCVTSIEAAPILYP